MHLYSLNLNFQAFARKKCEDRLDKLLKTIRSKSIIYQSINQSNFYSANIPGEARFSGATAKSVFNSKIEETVP